MAAAISREAHARGLGCEMLEGVPMGGGLSSALLSLDGADAPAFAAGWVGTVQWLCRSPVRPGHKRRRWFVGVSALGAGPDPLRPVRDADLEWQATRASGPGGQHVNKTQSAVRLLHRPSGIAVTAQEERSQHRNKALALAKLRRLLAEGQADAEQSARQGRWDTHNGLVRGQAVRTFEGPEFKPARG